MRIQLLCAANLYFQLLGIQELQHFVVYFLRIRFLFLILS